VAAGEESVTYAKSKKTRSSDPATITLKRRRRRRRMKMFTTQINYFLFSKSINIDHKSAEQSNSEK